jgi:hypothetical protein
MPIYRTPMNVVPLFVPRDAEFLEQAPTTPPQLTYRGGPLLAAVKIYTIFWGSAWKQPANLQTANSLNDFFTFLVTSPLIDQLAEYNIPGTSIGHGSFLGSLTVTAKDPASTVADSDIQTLIQNLIAAGSIPASDPNTLYFVYLPSGVEVDQGGDASCKVFCGYHDAIADKTFYAVMPFPDCTGCLGGLTAFNALTGTSSHEFCEAVTDPIPGQGWYDDNNGEIGDICAWKFKQLGKYTVQLEWSNKANSCA